MDFKKNDRRSNNAGGGKTVVDGDDFGGPDEFIDGLYDDLEETQPVVKRKVNATTGDDGIGDVGTTTDPKGRRTIHGVQQQQQNQQQQQQRCPISNNDDCGPRGNACVNDIVIDNVTLYGNAGQNEQHQRQEESKNYHHHHRHDILLRQVQDENKCLKRNISILFRTAKNELQRKDDKIQQLQQQLDGLIRQHNKNR